MTVVIGLNLDVYAMIAVDTRITSYLPNGASFFKDDCEKLQHTSNGLITGLGFATLLDAVKEWLDAGRFECVSLRSVSE